MITGVTWHGGSPDMAWVAGGRIVSKRFRAAVRTAVVLRDASGIAVVLEAPRGVLDAALIVNEDGSERCVVGVSSWDPYSTHLEQMYYDGEELKLFATVGGIDWAYVVDERSGSVVREHESR